MTADFSAGREPASKVEPPPGWPSAAGFLQFRVRFGDPAANLAVMREQLAALAPPPGSLVLLPELWAGGFAYTTLARQAAAGPKLLAALAEEARRRQIHLAGSLPEAGRGQASAARLYYNTLYLVGPGGVLGGYRKQRLFAPMDEPSYFQPGASFPHPLAAPWWPLGGLVCFDLRFPQLAAAQVRQGATLLLVAAQWPRLRLEHWQVLLRARAIENQVFVLACNTCGRVGDTDFAGHSMLIAPDGTLLVAAAEADATGLAPLDFARLVEARRLFCTAGGELA